jgi:hypothetical protein
VITKKLKKQLKIGKKKKNIRTLKKKKHKRPVTLPLPCDKCLRGCLSTLTTKGMLDKATTKGKELCDEVKELKVQLSQSHKEHDAAVKAGSALSQQLHRSKRFTHNALNQHDQMKVAYEDVLKMRQQDLQKSDVKIAELESKSRSLAEVMCREAQLRSELNQLKQSESLITEEKAGLTRALLDMQSKFDEVTRIPDAEKDQVEETCVFLHTYYPQQFACCAKRLQAI